MVDAEIEQMINMVKMCMLNIYVHQIYVNWYQSPIFDNYYPSKYNNNPNNPGLQQLQIMMAQMLNPWIEPYGDGAIQGIPHHQHNWINR